MLATRARMAAGGGGTASDSPGAADLVAYWTLNEASGTRADSHGSIDLTDNNTVGSAAGIKANGADFVNANDEYLSSTSASLQLGNSDWTLCFWFNADSLAGNPQLMTKDSVSNRNYTIDISAGRCRFYINGNLIVNDSTILSTGTWYFVVAWHDATANTVNISVNDNTPGSAGTGGTAPPTGSAAFMLGRRDYLNFESPFDGTIDEAFIFSRVLTAAERTWLYNSGAGRTYGDL